MSLMGANRAHWLCLPSSVTSLGQTSLIGDNLLSRGLQATLLSFS